MARTAATTEKSANAVLSASAYQHIRQKLVSGSLSAGTKISEQALADELGISRTPVRDALRQLEQEGLIERVPRVGTIVREHTTKEIRQLYELRIALERYAVERFALEHTETELAMVRKLYDQLRNLSDQMRDCQDDQELANLHRKAVAVDIAFHMAIIQCTENDWIIRSLKEARTFTRIIGARRRVRLHHDALQHIAHGKILEAVERCDAEEAGRRMVEHIRESMEGSVRDMEHEERGCRIDAFNLDIHDELSDELTGLI